jgi:ABC-2 type transport system permease protein
MQASSPATLRPSWMWTVTKYFNIFRVSLIERLAYRGDFLLGTVLRFLPVMTTILLWEAIFAGSDQAVIPPIDPNRPDQVHFTRHQMIAYLLLIHISRMFSSMPGLASGIARDIREGTLKKYLIQPLDMIGYLLSYRAAHKVAYIATSALPYAGLFLVCVNYFDGFPDVLTFFAYLLSLILAFMVGFFFETSLGMMGFWFLEISSLLWIITTLTFFISGQMVPLDILGPYWGGVVKLLPFQYLAYFPAVVFLGKVTGVRLIQGLAMQMLWVVVLVLFTRGLYAVGLRRYSAYGG